MSVLILCSLLAWGDGPDLVKLVTGLDKSPKVLGIFYSGDGLPAGTPNRVGNIRLLKIPLQSPRDLSKSLDMANKDLGIRHFLVLDDGGTLTTHPRALKYLARQARKHDLKIFANMDRIDPEHASHIKLVDLEGRQVAGRQ